MYTVPILVIIGSKLCLFQPQCTGETAALAMYRSTMPQVVVQGFEDEPWLGHVILSCIFWFFAFLPLLCLCSDTTQNVSFQRSPTLKSYPSLIP